ncbi:hypothetical protein WA158_006827 [Blastocystis sp. Blastoise]
MKINITIEATEDEKALANSLMKSFNALFAHILPESSQENNKNKTKISVDVIKNQYEDEFQKSMIFLNSQIESNSITEKVFIVTFAKIISLIPTKIDQITIMDELQRQFVIVSYFEDYALYIIIEFKRLFTENKLDNNNLYQIQAIALFYQNICSPTSIFTSDVLYNALISIYKPNYLHFYLQIISNVLYLFLAKCDNTQSYVSDLYAFFTSLNEITMNIDDKQVYDECISCLEQELKKTEEVVLAPFIDSKQEEEDLQENASLFIYSSGQTKSITSLVYSDLTQELFSASEDGSLYIYNTDPSQPATTFAGFVSKQQRHQMIKKIKPGQFISSLSPSMTSSHLLMTMNASGTKKPSPSTQGGLYIYTNKNNNWEKSAVYRNPPVYTYYTCSSFIHRQNYSDNRGNSHFLLCTGYSQINKKMDEGILNVYDSNNCVFNLSMPYISYKQHKGPITCIHCPLSIPADIITGSYDSTINIYDIRQQEQVTQLLLDEPNSTIKCISSINTDDQYIISTSFDGSIYIYDHRNLSKLFSHNIIMDAIPICTTKLSNKNSLLIGTTNGIYSLLLENPSTSVTQIDTIPPLSITSMCSYKDYLTFGDEDGKVFVADETLFF